MIWVLNTALKSIDYILRYTIYGIHLRFKVLSELEIVIHRNSESSLKTACAAMLSHELGLRMPLVRICVLHPIGNSFHAWH